MCVCVAMCLGELVSCVSFCVCVNGCVIFCVFVSVRVLLSYVLGGAPRSGRNVMRDSISSLSLSYASIYFA